MLAVYKFKLLSTSGNRHTSVSHGTRLWTKLAERAFQEGDKISTSVTANDLYRSLSTAIFQKCQGQ